MIEIHPRIFVGTVADYRQLPNNQTDWWTVHACKEPYHRQLLGYTTNGAPQGHAEYLVARRDRRLYLNIVDVEDPRYISKRIIDAALAFVYEGLQFGGRVLIHCNQGESRSPSIGMLYLAARTDAIRSVSLEAAENDFRLIYPLYSPKNGIRGFLMQHWNDYILPQSQLNE